MRRVSRKEEQHRLGSDHLHEVEAWKPPTPPRRRKPPEQLPGQLDLAAAVEDSDEEQAP